MDCEDTARNLLERMLLNASAEPTILPLSLLKAVTNDFSDDQKIGSGGFADVYKGLLQNGTVAVKKLFQAIDINEKNFIQEVSSLIEVKHKNIVRFLGYCADTQGIVEKYEGKVVIADEQRRLLCFEFVPNGGLDKYISDASRGLDWRTRYQIIKGICRGLQYLHQKNIVHLDLKPANILLDDYMVPKIADFGISKCFDETQTRAITSKIYGSPGYIAPEFYGGEFTLKSDIYSLGIIIIEMLAGRKGYPDITNVLQNWRTRFETSQGDTWLEHVRLCVEIGTECTDSNPVKRPCTTHIIQRLDELDRTHGFIETDLCSSSATHIPSLGSTETSKLLDIQPLELRFPLEPYRHHIECPPVTFTNRTDNRYVGVWIIPADQETRSYLRFPVCSRREPVEGRPRFQMVEPRSSSTVAITMKNKQHQRTGKLEVLMVVMGSVKGIRAFNSSFGSTLAMDTYSDDILKKAEELGGEVYRSMLTIVTYDPTSCEDAIHNQKLIQTSEFGRVTCMDVHPTETWILAGHEGGHASIWNYQTEDTVMVLQVTKADTSAAKFIAQEQWFAAGDDDGWVHVYAYPTRRKVKKFQPHDDDPISSLAVHPTDLFLLTSSYENNSIKLWDWGQGWICTRVFDGHSVGVDHITFHPRDTDTFASSSRFGNQVKVWNIRSPEPIFNTTLEGASTTGCHFYSDSHQHFLLTGAWSGGGCAMMLWDLLGKQRVGKLAMRSHFSSIACHPTLPILATVISDSYDGRSSIYFWDGRTYRVEKVVKFVGDVIRSVEFIGTTDLTRLVARHYEGISIIDLNLPTLNTDLLSGAEFVPNGGLDKRISEPTFLPLSLLKAITNNFSDDQKIGSGGFADVYKGQLQNGTVAVKKLSQAIDIDEKYFTQEVSSMIRVKHKNIVRFVGYCADTQGRVEEHKGKEIIVDERQRLLCYEFVPNGGLDKRISDASRGLDWRTRYQIIKGICRGLQYLHQKKIVHFCLKPAKILLDDYMVPKILGSGLSKCFDETQTRAITSNIYGSQGYIAPECYGGEFTLKSDIYSLGCIIIEMLTGRKGYPDIKNVLENWRTRFETSQGDTWLEHVRLCAEIGIECIDFNPMKRPSIRHIIHRLDEMDRTYGFIESDLCSLWATHIPSMGSTETSKLLDIQPLELRFPLEPYSRHIECPPVTFTNRTDDRYMGVWIIPANQDTRSYLRFPVCSRREPVEGRPHFQMVEPRSSSAVAITMENKQHQWTGKLEVLMVVMGSVKGIREFNSSFGSTLAMDTYSDDILKRVEELGGEVYQAMLTAVTYDPAICKDTIHNQKLIQTLEFGRVTCMDVHPTETWILAGHEGGRASIWNYQTEDTVMVLQVTKADTSSAKFIAQEHWFAVGDDDGWVHVYAYPTRSKVKKFQPHDDDPISSLAVHPTNSFLLTSSYEDNSVKLWDWSQGWICTRTFDGHSVGVDHIMFHPRDTDTFASSSHFGNEVKVWDIRSSEPIFNTTLEGASTTGCHFYTDSHQHFLLTGAWSGGGCAMMLWDLQGKQRVGKLAMRSHFSLIACHPTLPILATVISESYDGRSSIYLWDGRTYRVEKVIKFVGDIIRSVEFIGTTDLTRLVARHDEGISIMDFNLPTLNTDLLSGGGN